MQNETAKVERIQIDFNEEEIETIAKYVELLKSIEIRLKDNQNLVNKAIVEIEEGEVKEK